MREIKFRGKSICEDVITTRDSRIAKGDWVYGSLIVDTQPYIVGEIADVDFEFIAPEFWIPVDKNTIGQFTGLKDKNGKEIYEGDIVKYTESYGCSDRKKEVRKSEVKIYPSYTYPFSNVQEVDDCWYSVEHTDYEVIGNIHNNEVKE